MTRTLCRYALPAVLLLTFAAGGALLWLRPWPGASAQEPKDARPAQQRVVYLLSPQLVENDRLALLAALARRGQAGVVLFDTSTAARGNRTFLREFRPERVVPIGTFRDGPSEMARRLGIRSGLLRRPVRRVSYLWDDLFPRAAKAVVCDTGSRRRLLQAACLAGTLEAPLFVLARKEDGDALRRWLRRRPADAGPVEVFVSWKVSGISGLLQGQRVHTLRSSDAFAAAQRKALGAGGPVETLVVANPYDRKGGAWMSMSTLAPWLAARKRAALLLTRSSGKNAAELVRKAVREPGLEQAEFLLLAAHPDSLPPERRPNPAPGKDRYIESEPPTPRADAVFTFATGRLFHRDPAVVALMQARQDFVLPEQPGPRRALIVCNPGGGLVLCETISRLTARELANGGYRTTALYDLDVEKEDFRRLMPRSDIVLWEGHINTLKKDYGFARWDESLRPSLVFIQSCLGLRENLVGGLYPRGALAVVGAGSRTYSASGGAFTLSFFDALVYDGQTAGQALRHAKNFLLAYMELKKKRLGSRSKLPGANLRSAWAFTLWGDPTLRFPQPASGKGGLPPIRHKLSRKALTLTVMLPEKKHDEVRTFAYRAEAWPYARLAGYLRDSGDPVARELIPLVFVEVPFPRGKSGTPRLSSKVPRKRWVFNWDARRRTGYLLVLPRKKDTEEIRFRVHWDNAVTRSGS